MQLLECRVSLAFLSSICPSFECPVCFFAPLFCPSVPHAYARCLPHPLSAHRLYSIHKPILQLLQPALPPYPFPTLLHHIMPRLEEWEIKKYWEIFQGLKPENNRLSGEKVAVMFKNSRLEQEQLLQVWQLADIDADGSLDFEEFCIAMRLIFDLVNGKTQDVPAELPPWLVPLSKAHLIQANRAVAHGSNAPSFDTSDDDDHLSDDFDWYISPTDRATYEALYSPHSDTHGRVRYEALDALHATLLNVPKAELSSAWNLVNPKSFETIDKDQALVLLHILNQREHGKRIPHGVPASLRATFSKEVPTYDVSSQASVTAPPEPRADDKLSFGTNYLNKISKAAHSERGTDFSTTEDTDWEKVRLRRELASLETQLADVQRQKDRAAADLGATKREFEQLLAHKEQQLDLARRAPAAAKDLPGVRNDMALISSQICSLEEYLKGRECELEQLRSELSKV